MERPSKRRRLYQRDGLRRAHHSFADFQDPEANVALLNEDKSHTDEAPLRQAFLHGALNDLKQPESLADEVQKVQPRQIGSDSVSQVAQPAATAVESVVRVIIDNPAGTAVGDVLVPAQSSVFTFDGYGSVTLPSNAGSTSPPQPPARFESPPAYTTPGPQSQAPQPTQQSASMSTDQSSTRPSEAPPGGVSASANSSASQSPMTISVPGSSSQVVLSSPPATPAPSNPSSSLSATSPTNTGSTASYFSLSPSVSSSTSPQTSDTSNPNQTPTNHNNVPAPTSGNFSMTSFTSVQTSTGSKGPTILTFATPISNSTMITSTRTSSSSSSGTGTISSTSSQETSTMTTSSSTTTSASSTMSTSSNLSTSSSSSSALSSSSATSTTSSAGIVPGGIGGVSGSPTGTTPSSTASSGTGSGGSSAPSTPTVVGGVVGGVAGLTIILLLLLVLFRWRRKKMVRGRNISPPMAQTIPPAGGAQSGTVTERSSNVPFAAAGFFKRMRPRSSATAATTETAPSERGFQNFGGRKIESVLESGGDGFGNPGPSSSTAPGAQPARGIGASTAAGLGAGFRPASPQTPLSETSFYRDSQGFYGGAPEPEPSSNPSSMYGRPESPPPRSPDRPGPGIASSSPQAHGGSQAQRDQEIAFMRPGPARTPVTNQPGFSSLRLPTPSGRGTPPPRHLPAVGASPTPRDGVGRSHPSFDGSRGSRFTEEMVPP